jgi:pimeloyl-ACP methyl ester carboxylesterase
MKAIFYRLAYYYFLLERYRKLQKEFGFREKKVKLFGQTIHYQISPKPNKPLVCIHGFLDSAIGFRKLAPYLLDDFQLFLVDIPSFGRSQLPENKYLFQLDLFSQMIYDSIKKLGLENITLLGHSMGGLIAQHIALLDKEKRIQNLVLLSSANSPHPNREDIRKLLFPKNREDFKQLLGELYFKTKKEPSNFMLDTLVYIWNSPKYLYMAENTIEKEQEIFIGKNISKIKIPILFVSGKEDIFTTEEDMKKMNSWVTNGKLSLLENAKHAIHLEYPETVAQEIINFSKQFS